MSVWYVLAGQAPPCLLCTVEIFYDESWSHHDPIVEIRVQCSDAVALWGSVHPPPNTDAGPDVDRLHLLLGLVCCKLPSPRPALPTEATSGQCCYPNLLCATELGGVPFLHANISGTNIAGLNGVAAELVLQHCVNAAYKESSAPLLRLPKLWQPCHSHWRTALLF